MKMNGYSIIGLISLSIFLFILLIIAIGFFMVIKLGIHIFQNKNSVFGATFIVLGFSLMLIFSYITLGKYSKGAYSILGQFENVFYTGVIYDENCILKQNKNGEYLAYDKEGNLFTGVSKTYFEKLRLSPFKTKENGISYFVNGYFMGSSQSPDEPLKVSQIPKMSVPENIDINILIHKDYEKYLNEEIENWGEYFIINKDETALNPNYKIIYAVCINKDKITKKEIAFYKNGVIAEIRPYYPEKFDEWSSGGGNYLFFDSLGFLTKKEKWNENGSINYENFQKREWKYEDFVYKKTYPNILKEKESKNKEFSKKIFYPDRPDFLENSERWEKENRNFDNFYLLFGGNPDYTEKVGIVVYARQNGEMKKFSLDEKTGGVFASALAAGKLVTTAKDSIENFSDGKGFEFILFLNNKEICSFLFKNDQFYMDNGIYAVSLLPKDAENDEHKFYMEQARNELKNMLEELTGTDTDHTVYITSEN